MTYNNKWKEFNTYRKDIMKSTRPVVLKFNTRNKCVVQSMMLGCKGWNLINSL